jgi:hypothetical protein
LNRSPTRGWPTPVLALILSTAAACDGGTTVNLGQHAPFAGCVGSPTAPPASLGLDPFYRKYLDGNGTPVVSSAEVSDRALGEACRITGELVAARAEVRAALAANDFHVAVLARSERTTDIPEYADLYAVFPDTDWNQLRGIGATHARPVASGSEENLLCLSGDIYAGQSILVQMTAHALRDLGIVDVDAQFGGAIRAAYASAMSAGLWADTFAAEDPDVYWAAGSQAWFGANSHLPVNDRAAVTAYDPGLGALLAQYLPSDRIHLGCY